MPDLSSPLRLGTRSSPLARWQADWVQAELERRGHTVEQIMIETAGDRRQDAISELGGRGVFTKEIQVALLDRRIDVAVHSLKDLPTDAVPGLVLAAVPVRGPTGDVLVSRQAPSIDEFAAGARIATSSRRRRAQLLAYRPDLEVVDVRGNVGTRLRKLDDGMYDGLVLAEAGLRRLGLEDRITQRIPPHVMFAAVGQGALGLETRADDAAVLETLAPINDPRTWAEVTAERSMLARLHGGCLAPVGVHSDWDNEGTLQLVGVVLSPDGRQRLEAQAMGSPDQAAEIGTEVARRLLDLGAAGLIATSRQANPHDWHN